MSHAKGQGGRFVPKTRIRRPRLGVQPAGRRESPGPLLWAEGQGPGLAHEGAGEPALPRSCPPRPHNMRPRPGPLLPPTRASLTWPTPPHPPPLAGTASPSRALPRLHTPRPWSLLFSPPLRVSLLMFRAKGSGGEREKHQSAASHTHPDWKSNPQPKYVRQPGIKPRNLLVYETTLRPAEPRAGAPLPWSSSCTERTACSASCLHSAYPERTPPVWTPSAPQPLEPRLPRTRACRVEGGTHRPRTPVSNILQ